MMRAMELFIMQYSLFLYLYHLMTLSLYFFYHCYGKQCTKTHTCVAECFFFSLYLHWFPWIPFSDIANHGGDNIGAEGNLELPLSGIRYILPFLGYLASDATARHVCLCSMIQCSNINAHFSCYFVTHGYKCKSLLPKLCL